MLGLCGTPRASSRGAFFDYRQHVDEGRRELVAHQQGRGDREQGEPHVCRVVPGAVFSPRVRDLHPLMNVAVVSRFLQMSEKYPPLVWTFECCRLYVVAVYCTYPCGCNTDYYEKERCYLVCIIRVLLCCHGVGDTNSSKPYVILVQRHFATCHSIAWARPRSRSRPPLLVFSISTRGAID